MNEEIYISKLTELSGAIHGIMSKKMSGEMALYEIAVVAHYLCQSIFLKRGSAAVNGGIIKALCKEMGYPIANLRIEGLPFDIYAQFQVDKDKFARALGKAVLGGKLEQPNLEMQR